MSQSGHSLARAFRGISEDLRLRPDAANIAPTSPLRFFTIRHGQSVGQLDITAYKTPGDALIPLTDWGRQQSREAGEFLRQLSLDFGLGSFEVWHSTCRRTKETSENLADGLGSDLVISQQPDIRLDKQIFGLFSGIFDDKEKAQLYPREFQHYQEELLAKGTFFARPPGGESLADVQAKSKDFVKSFTGVAHSKARNIVVVTHGTPTLCIENTLTNRGSNWVLQNIDHVPNCDIRLIENSKGYFEARKLGQGLKKPAAHSPGTLSY
ncbi:MAG: histidine phosphatase family protein [Alphaproteobacteria bacterium]